MTESELKAKIKALEEALKRDQNKLARLEAKHKEDKRVIKNLKRRKDPKAKASGATDVRMSPKKKEQLLRSMKPIGLSAQQKEKLEELFPGITTMSSLFD